MPEGKKKCKSFIVRYDLTKNCIIMTSNVALSEKSSAADDALESMASSSGIDIRIEKDESDGKDDEIVEIQPSPSSDAKSLNVSDDLSGSEVQVNSVSSCNLDKTSSSYALETSKSNSKISERAKRKSWYHHVYPSYKSRSDTFHKLFKEVPDDQRLIVDYSCALQREILVHGRMFVSQHYLCFHANIFGWETYLCLKWKNITGITKEKTALVIPNAILICTEQEKYFITSFAARDKTYLMLFRIWQNALMDKPMLPQEIWQCVHNAYGDQLGLTSDDEDYIDPKDGKSSNNELDALEDSSKLLNSSDIETDHSFEKKTKTKHGNKSNSLDSNTSRSTQSKMRRMNEDPDYIPTDVSNTTDSEEENSIPFVCTAECTSMHEGRELVKTILPINVDSLLTLLFSKSKFFSEFHNKRKTTNMVFRDWVDNDDGTKCRTINFTVAVTQAVGPKTSNMTEVQVMRHCSVPGQLYSIDITSTNAGIPYADSFHIATHYCLFRTVDDHTMLSVYVQIKYTKSVWGVVKGFIEKNVWNGLEDFYKALLSALQSEYLIPPAKSKSRRTKRALTQKLSIEDPPSKRSSLKANQKTATIQSIVPSPLSSTIFKGNAPTNLQSSTPSKQTNRTFQTFDFFSIVVVILIIALVLLNVFLLIELYMLKSKHDDEISINRLQLDRLLATSDPSELRENWLKLLNQQKTTHDAELVKWQGFVKSTVELLQKIKGIYSKFSSELKIVESHAKEEF